MYHHPMHHPPHHSAMPLNFGASELPTPPEMQSQPLPPHSVLPAPNGQHTQPHGQVLTPVSGRKDGKIWAYVALIASLLFHQLTWHSLKVEQQPVRARMCGFGDKVSTFCTGCDRSHGRWSTGNILRRVPQDRRPITPPPCIRLVVHDEKTGVEVDFKYAIQRVKPFRLPCV